MQRPVQCKFCSDWLGCSSVRTAQSYFDPRKSSRCTVVEVLTGQRSIAARRRSVLVLARAGKERSTSAKPDSPTVRVLRPWCDRGRLLLLAGHGMHALARAPGQILMGRASTCASFQAGRIHGPISSQCQAVLVPRHRYDVQALTPIHGLRCHRYPVVRVESPTWARKSTQRCSASCRGTGRGSSPRQSSKVTYL